jgi:hypothetical protein
MNAGEQGYEGLGDQRQIDKGERGLRELPRLYSLADQMADDLAHPLRGAIVDHPHRRLGRVGQHQDAGLPAARPGARIAEFGVRSGAQPLRTGELPQEAVQGARA